MPDKLLLSAIWTNDVAGKADYDGNILSISTRYWRDHTAHSSLILRHGHTESISLADRYFSGESQADVMRQVEAWAQEQMDRVVGILRQHFDFDRKPSWP